MIDQDEIVARWYTTHADLTGRWLVGGGPNRLFHFSPRERGQSRQSL
jgi:hypothetical protein